MRIAYVHQYFTTPSMPGGTRSFEMAKRFVQAGHDVHMITTDRSPKTQSGWRITSESGIVAHWLPVPYENRMSYRDRIQAFIKFAVHAGQRISSVRPDVIFATSTPLTVALPAIYASRRRSVPMVFEVRDLWPEVPIAMGALSNPVLRVMAQGLERLAYRNSAHIVALSEGMKKGIVSLGYSPSDVTVIPNSCDFDRFQGQEAAGCRFRQSHEWLRDRPLILYAGTLGSVNGVEYLVRTASEMLTLSSEVRFLVVGNGRERERVKGLAEYLKVLNRNFFMMDSVSKSEIGGVMAAASITTSTVIDVPALWHNSANKFFDSLAAGRPIAINYEGWQADLLRETGAGLVLPANDTTKAAEILSSFLADPDEVKRAGLCAIATGRERYDRDILAMELLDLLHQVARG